MVRVISDTSTMYSTKEAREAGFAVSPLAVTIAGESYRELDEMSAARFVEIINQGNMPASSQPAIGEVMELYEEFKGDEHVGQPCRKASWESLEGKTRGKTIDPLIHGADCVTLLLPLWRKAQVHARIRDED